jgi:hypothetical protein
VSLTYWLRGRMLVVCEPFPDAHSDKRYGPWLFPSTSRVAFILHPLLKAIGVGGLSRGGQGTVAALPTVASKPRAIKNCMMNGCNEVKLVFL